MPQIMRAPKVKMDEVGPGRLDRGLVDPPQVGGGQRRPGTVRDAVAATGPGEDQVLGTGAGGELAGDRFADLVAHGHHAHAGQALGLGLEAAPEPAGLIADLDDLDAAQLREDPAAAQPQQLPATQAGADLNEEVVAVERPAGGQEVADLLRGEGPSTLVTEDLFWIEARLGGLDLADRIGGEQVFLAGGLQDPQQDRATGHHPTVAEVGFEVVLPAQHDRGRDLAELAAAKVGPKVATQVAFGGLHALGAASWAGRPQAPPVVGPVVEQDAAAARVDPGVGGGLGEELVLEVSGQGAAVEGLGPLGAVVEAPPDLVAGAVAVLANAGRCHRPHLRTSSTGTPPWDPACELPVLGRT